MVRQTPPPPLNLPVLPSRTGLRTDLKVAEDTFLTPLKLVILQRDNVNVFDILVRLRKEIGGWLEKTVALDRTWRVHTPDN
jgi:hypothetical protein